MRLDSYARSAGARNNWSHLLAPRTNVAVSAVYTGGGIAAGCVRKREASNN